MQNAARTTPVKGVPQTTRLREDKRFSARLHATVRIEPLERTRQGGLSDLGYLLASTQSQPTPSQPALGKQVLLQSPHY